MKFAFTRRETVKTIVWYAAETEQDAWQLAIDGINADEASDPELDRLPVFRRVPDLDEVEAPPATDKSWDEVFADKEKTGHGTFVTREYDL